MKFTKLEKDILMAIASGKTKDNILAEKITTLKCLMNTLTAIYKKTAELVQYKTERNKFEELSKFIKENSVLLMQITETQTELTEDEEETFKIQASEQGLTKEDFHKSLQSLTPKEKDLLNFLAVTPNYKKAAENFNNDLSTIKTHVNNLFGKFFVSTLAELVAIYYRFSRAKSNNNDIISDLHIKYINEINRHRIEIMNLEQKIEVLDELQGEVIRK